MITLSGSAFAKVNLTLDVLGKREDGYHDLCSVMQTISLHDSITVELNTGEPWRLSCDADGVPCDSRNLAWKAARAFYDAAGQEPDGVTIRIVKRIPSQAGLGGGSADAAAVLRLLNEQRHFPFSVRELCALGARVGSDVPFCVLGGTALAEGRGERLTKLPDAPQMYFVVCKPAAAFSTPELFAGLDAVSITERPDTEAMCDALRRKNAAGVGRCLCNVFEQAVTDGEIAAIKSALLRCGALGAQMTGSGSAVYGIFETEQAARNACNKMSGVKVFCAKPV